MVGALFPSMNGCDASRVQWESSLLSPDVKDASASLQGAPEGINTHESNGPELSFCESAVRQVLQPATCCSDPSGDPGADPLASFSLDSTLLLTFPPLSELPRETWKDSLSS